MKLFTTSVFVGLASVFQMIAGLTNQKILATYLGPAGLGMVGQFVDFFSIGLLFSRAAIDSGVLKYTATYEDQKEDQERLIGTSICIVAILSIISTIGVNAYSDFFSLHIFRNSGMSRVISISSMCFFFPAMSCVLLNVLAGKGAKTKFLIANYISSVLVLTVSVFTVFFGLKGAIFAYPTFQSVVAVFVFYIYLKAYGFPGWGLLRSFSIEKAVFLLKYGLMHASTMVILPLTMMYVRNLIGTHVSLESVGYWQGIWKISDMIQITIVMFLNLHLFPVLSREKNSDLFSKKLIETLTAVIVMVGCGCILIYILRDYIINFLLSDKFLDMRQLFPYQLLGDTLKSAAFVLKYIMLAKAMTKLFILTETIYFSSLAVAAHFLIPKFGIIGASYSYLAVNALYFMTLFFIYRRILFSDQGDKTSKG
ncbi:MAG: hypothetical protein CVV64_11380 [Candidatus Wallbacteria bacterium HGW-Wallbacteria-1]|jgi:PST family polysaccharide transporter|uniref:O-antigen translocase n=1 Tax=Candidatus Wallbacteria bacterium HGW-Wallbacteria-1 TaxID=2013854 RepID=A0A2N1PP46_9BACT|nr:MAG: hypothetical protein CVV64_11380 [Candidatus Wallbacteria bacterium HGW-Wallbacteria-1]